MDPMGVLIHQRARRGQLFNSGEGSSQRGWHHNPQVEPLGQGIYPGQGGLQRHQVALDLRRDVQAGWPEDSQGRSAEELAEGPFRDPHVCLAVISVCKL